MSAVRSNLLSSSYFLQAISLNSGALDKLVLGNPLHSDRQRAACHTPSLSLTYRAGDARRLHLHSRHRRRRRRRRPHRCSLCRSAPIRRRRRKENDWLTRQSFGTNAKGNEKRMKGEQAGRQAGRPAGRQAGRQRKSHCQPRRQVLGLRRKRRRTWRQRRLSCKRKIRKGWSRCVNISANFAAAAATTAASAFGTVARREPLTILVINSRT